MKVELRMQTGSIVHAVLEFAYLKSSKTKKMEWEKIQEELMQQWKESIALSPTPVSLEELQPFVQKSMENIQYYYHSHFLPENEATIGIEHKIMLPLFPQKKQWMIGFLDRISSPEENKIVVHDYKTGNLNLTNETLLLDFQAGIYGAMAAHAFGNETPLKELELKWHYLSHQKTVSAKFTPDASRNAIQKAQFLSTQVEYSNQTGLFPIKEGRHCEWCDFESICPAKKK